MWCRPLHGVIDPNTMRIRSRDGVVSTVSPEDRYVRVTFWNWLGSLCGMALKLRANGLKRRQAVVWFVRTMFTRSHRSKHETWTKAHA